MKNLLLLAAGFLASSTYAQCTIAGNDNIKPNETTSLTVDAKAQCDECYSWKSSDLNIKIDGKTKTNKIDVSSSQIGKSTISVSVFTNQGLQQCEKIINVAVPALVAATPAVKESKQNIIENSCGIPVDDFKDVKVSESIISFFPNGNPTSYTYKWSVSYANGEVQESSEKIPQFFYSDVNYITLVKLKITKNNPICSVTISKKFDENFWKAKKYSNLQQKVYSPISYSEYVKPAEEANSSK
ncbi:hypothetical protein [Epilithonimonas xixisoli]|uniref:Ig-like domain-containing protein n=1 Tax=Epilithonimonas xixisoli TaxID=1476462 RepID=A0A4R8ID63_9FLAO|nr:hypothetical protein [Epilithonimonas xixisoli]TDX82695.1 hypothetical protein B0I22_2715 [Epilithonimonas xixisoli]